MNGDKCCRISHASCNKVDIIIVFCIAQKKSVLFNKNEIDLCLRYGHQ